MLPLGAINGDCCTNGVHKLTYTIPLSLVLPKTEVLDISCTVMALAMHPNCSYFSVSTANTLLLVSSVFLVIVWLSTNVS